MFVSSPSKSPQPQSSIEQPNGLAEASTIPDGRRIYMTNLPFSASWQDIKDLLREKLGKVGRVELFLDSNGRSRGSALIDFSRVLKENYSEKENERQPFISNEEAEELAQHAMNELNGYEFRGRPLIVRPDRVGKRRPPPTKRAKNDENTPQTQQAEETSNGISTEQETEDNSFQTISKTRRGKHRLTAEGKKRIESGNAKSTYNVGKNPASGANKPRLLQRYQADAFDDSVKPRTATEPEYKRSQFKSNVNDQSTQNGNNHENMIHIGNLPFRTAWQDLKDLLAQYGQVLRCDVAADRLTGRPKGFATARFATKEEAEKVIEAINGMELQGRELRAKPYVWREYK